LNPAAAGGGNDQLEKVLHIASDQGPLRFTPLRVFLVAIVCFLVANTTNDSILRVLAGHHLMYGADSSAAVNAEKTARFFIIPLKSLLFFVCGTALLFPLGRYLYRKIRGTLTGEQVRRTIISMIGLLVLISVFFLYGYGRSYARLSTDPFNQDPGQTYRRLLLPGMANVYHLDGFLFTFLIWFLIFVTALTIRLYLSRKDIDLSIFQEVSLLSVGVTASAYELPGQPEFFVFLLALIALLMFEDDGKFTWKQLAALSLALITHEAAAVIIFAPMIVFLFGRRSWLPCGLLLAVYAATIAANFSFHFGAPVALQTTVSGHSAAYYFRAAPYRVPLGGLSSFKFLWVFFFFALVCLVRTNLRLVCFMVAGVLIATAATYSAVDYSRVVGFATLPILFATEEAEKRLSRKVFNGILALNLIAPSVLFGAEGLSPCKGLYLLVYMHLFALARP
jgi:hypothetical protein